MDYVIVCATALIASGLTFFSGFGLGTILLPAFALFFAPAAAVLLTAVVHLLNNLFKLVLMGKHTNAGVAARFGVPAVLASVIGAYLLGRLSELTPLGRYELFGAVHTVQPLGIVLGVLITAFAFFEVAPSVQRLKLDRRHLWWGGALSGFFGGLSGHQGALRSAFLLKTGLTKEAFIGTGVVISCFVDVTRISVYGVTHVLDRVRDESSLLLAAAFAAFAGAVLGKRLLTKVEMPVVQKIVAVMLVLLAVGLGTGLY